MVEYSIGLGHGSLVSSVQTVAFNKITVTVTIGSAMPCRTSIAWWVGRNPERERETRLEHRSRFVGDSLNCQGLAYMRPKSRA